VRAAVENKIFVANWSESFWKRASELKVSSILETPVSLGGKSSAVAVFTYSDLLAVLFMMIIYRKIIHVIGRRILKPAGARLPEKWLSSKLIPADERGTVRWIESVERAVGLFLMLHLVVMACQFGVVLAVRLGITIWPKLPYAISRIATIGYFAFVLDTFYGWLLSERSDLALSQKFVLGRLGTVLIYAIAFLLFVETTGLPLRSVLAFGGIGGLAIGLAAQELAKNFISGVMLALGAPFAPGESVQLNTIGVSGEVRQIGFYKTELIGADGRPTWIPNAQLVNERLTNNSRITNRRLAHRFGLRYQDIDKVGKIVNQVREMLAEIPEIAASRDSISVYFTEYAEYSLPIQLTCFVNVTDGKRFLEIQQQVLLSVNRIVKSEGADFALPTRTIECLPTPAPR
jgi:MscS family membrane protein